MWEASREHQWSAVKSRYGAMLQPVWRDMYHAVSDGLVGSRHHACTTAFPTSGGNLVWMLDEWLRPDFTSPGHDENELIQRIVGYAALRRALVLSEWALVDVAAMREIAGHP